jgi:chromosome segregation ATPase
MDVQHSTAPLMRQLESTERQNRARAAAWAEVETKLRSDLEDHIIQLENITKERNNLVSSEKRLQRLLKEKEEEIASSRETIGELSAANETLETRAEESEEEGKRMKQELVVAERKASEGASKVRSEMMLTVVESEERYRSQIDALKEELDNERHRRGDLEKQLDDLVESVTAAEFAQNHAMGAGGQRSPDRGKKLLSATDQASILQDTLGGFDSDVDDDDEGHENGSRQVHGQGGSFAAMEQLSLGLKGAKVELDALRKQLITSEETRTSLLEELGEARQAVEKLPLFEQRVSELTMEVKLKDMEIQGLQDDIADVRFLYRTQLDALLEEKATASSPLMQSEQDKTQHAIVFDDDCN